MEVSSIQLRKHLFYNMSIKSALAKQVTLNSEATVFTFVSLYGACEFIL